MQPATMDVQINVAQSTIVVVPNTNQNVTPTGTLQGRNYREILTGCASEAHVLRIVGIFLLIAFFLPETIFAYGIYKCNSDSDWEYCTIKKDLYTPETGRNIYIALAASYPFVAGFATAYFIWKKTNH